MTASPEDLGEAEADTKEKPKKVARPKPEKPTASSPTLDDFDRDALIAAIREVFSQNSELDRDSAIREVAHALGFGRTGSKIAEAIDSALIAAAKRGVIQNNRGYLSLLTRSIGDYSRGEMINTLLSVMGVVWWEREEAIRAAARHLGFKRTGSLIRDAFKSAINGAIRRGLLESTGSMIRKCR
ncbi:MAG: hypothetical protein AABO57_02095 [Acidobacteriota bacterium]